jgi:UDP-2,3-diacylglucosamine pyrophosphatase LpxH
MRYILPLPPFGDLAIVRRINRAKITVRRPRGGIADRAGLWTARSMARTFFVSDLHIFSRRSRDEMYRDSLQAAIDQAGCIVFGGDIFDFRWSTLPSFQATLNAADVWLEQLVQQNRDCQFHYILGNHDSHPRFVQRLRQLAERLSNLNWHPEYLRRDDDIFLHGDILDGPTTSHALAQRRRRWAHDTVRGPMSNALYDAAIAVRAHKVVGQLAHPRQRTARRLLSYLDHVGHGPQTGIQRVFFGHTHKAWNAFQYSKISFHNGGAPMTGLEFRILEVASPDRSTPAARGELALPVPRHLGPPTPPSRLSLG